MTVLSKQSIWEVIILNIEKITLYDVASLSFTLATSTFI
jgi:hypothetical protein